MKELKHFLSAFKQLSDRLKRLENIGIPKDGYTPIKGVDYFDGLPGKDGVPGRDGKDGKNGRDFTFDMFTPEQLSLLTGKQGEKGERGKPGKNGIDGKNGDPGRDGKQGPRGEKGAKGDKGDAGDDGRGIENVYIDEKGHLIIVFTDGEKKDVGRVVGRDGQTGYGVPGSMGPRGEQGISIVGVEIDKNGHLIQILSDGKRLDAGQLPYYNLTTNTYNSKNFKYNSRIKYN